LVFDESVDSSLDYDGEFAHPFKEEESVYEVLLRRTNNTDSQMPPPSTWFSAMLTRNPTLQGTLTILATITATQSFIRTSPFSHLLPPLSSLPLHPITYLRETLSVLRMHIDYETQRTHDLRMKAVLDAQKRRLYRRAHGMEDLNAPEEQGVDVRGLVEWDDGLTNKEREEGGREAVLTAGDMVRLGMREGEDMLGFTKRLEEDGERMGRIRRFGVDKVVREEEEEARRRKGVDGEGLGELGREGAAEMVQQGEQQPQERRKRKLWLGIW
jgi:hypothetical protein